jgi:phage terminase large subunit
LPVNPSAWTMTAWDLGMRDATAIWIIQNDGPWSNAIDYIESSGVGLDWYAGQLKERGYRYDQHIAPHDIEVRELGTGRSRREIAADLGIRFEVCAQHRIMDGISALRDLLPRMRFDVKKCERGIECLRMYRQNWDDKLGALSANPVHDFSSHGADAARIWAMGRHRTHHDEWSGHSPNVRNRNRDTFDGYHRALR